MRRIRPEEVLSLGEYERRREELRARVLEIKRPRRVHLGEHLTFLFETTETLLYQVQEMLRIERKNSDADLRHEVDTYNEVLGGDGELGCTLLIEIDDPLQRDLALRKWLDLPLHLYLRLADGRKVRPAYDPRQVGADRLSAVQYLKFRCDGAAPLAVGVDKPGLELERELNAEQRAALAEDLDLGAARLKR